MSKREDEYWYSIMQSLGDEFLNEATKVRQEEGIDSQKWRVWRKAGMEVKAVAEQALKTARVPEQLVQ